MFSFKQVRHLHNFQYDHDGFPLNIYASWVEVYKMI